MPVVFPNDRATLLQWQAHKEFISFGFCIPGSVNIWDAIYEVPPLSDDMIEQMIQPPP